MTLAGGPRKEACSESTTCFRAWKYIWSGGKGDVAAIMRVGGDERQRGIDRDATAITGLVMALAAATGAIIQTARNGDPGEYGVMCVVGGIAYTVGLIAFRHRR